MLKIRNLQKHYQNFELDVSFDLKKDQVIGLVGPNGAGKSTIFHSILDLVTPDSGEIELFGESVKNLSSTAKNRIGVTFPESFFSDNFTISDISKISEATYQNFQKDRFFEICERTNLPLNKPIKNFSTGMKAKLKIINALTHQAEFLLLDEPTLGLDVMVRNELIAMIQEYLDEVPNRSVLISSHISSDLEKLCDIIIMIDAGKIILNEETDTLLDDYGIIKITKQQYQDLDQQYLLKTKTASFGYQCLTNQRQFYQENYPDIVIERGSIDDILIFLTGKEVA